jgi:hypothetical protein
MFGLPTVSVSIAALLLVPSLASGQGIRMAPDFLPLDVGNLWRYDIVDDRGQSRDSIEFQVTEYTIVEGTSYYVFDQFPLAPGLEAGRPVAVRYDGQERAFIWFDGQNQSDLFPSLGATAEVLETDDNGLPFRAMFRFGSIILTLEMGVGIVQAGFESPEGPRVAHLVGARVAGTVVGELEDGRPGLGLGEPSPVAEPIENTTTVSADNPQLRVEALEGRGSHRFVLTVQNVSDRLLPFDFTTSQSFDFVVVDPLHGQEIWRWSRRRFFSQVIRSEAIRPGGEWTFEGEWNHRDSALDPVEPGTYEVFGILQAEDPIESEAIPFLVE